MSKFLGLVLSFVATLCISWSYALTPSDRIDLGHKIEEVIASSISDTDVTELSANILRAASVKDTADLELTDKAIAVARAAKNSDRYQVNQQIVEFVGAVDPVKVDQANEE